MTGKIELSVNISVEWRRSAMWGMCPTATVGALLAEDDVTVRRDRGSGHASGCGYDVISSDLLGCDADGVARRKFVDFLNGEEVAR